MPVSWGMGFGRVGADPLTGAILVGGGSRRMGTNKALLHLEPGGPTVIETVFQTLRRLMDDVVLVGNPTDDYAFLELAWFPDRMPNAGPLAGIQAALTGSRTDHVLVVACDMPFLNIELLRFMADQPRTYDVLVPEMGQVQPLHAIYARSCLPIIERHLAAGNLRTTGWFVEVDVRVIAQRVVEQHDPGLRSSFNLNTPEDLDVAREIFRSR